MTEQNNNVIIAIHPAIGYTIQNSIDDIGNISNDLRPYLKKEEYERDKENLVSDEELNSTLNNYTTNTGLSNELDNYVTKTFLTESLTDRPTFTYTDSTFARLATANTFTQPIEISNDGTTTTTLFKALMPSLASDAGAILTIGAEETTYNSIQLKHIYHRNAARECQLGFYGDNPPYLKFYSDDTGTISGSLKITGTLTTNNTITVNNTNNNKVLNLWNSGGETIIYMGKNETGTKKNRAAICWRWNGDDSNNNYLTFYIQGVGDIFQMYPNKVITNQPLTVSTTENTDYMNTVSILTPNMTANKHSTVAFGKTLSTTGDACRISYLWAGSNSANSALTLGFTGGYSDIFKFYRNKAEFNVPLNVNATVSNVLTTSTTAANCYVTHMCPNMGTDNQAALMFGKNSTTTNGCGTVVFKNSATKELNLGFNGNNNILSIKDDGNVETTGDITANGVNLNTAISGKADSSHTHTLSDITDASTLIENVETLTDQMLATQSALNNKASSTIDLARDMTANDFELDGGDHELDIFFNHEPITSGSFMITVVFVKNGDVEDVTFTFDYLNQTVSTDFYAATATYETRSSDNKKYIHCVFDTAPDEPLDMSSIIATGVDSITGLQYNLPLNSNDVLKYIVNYLQTKDSSFIENMISSLT